MTLPSQPGTLWVLLGAGGHARSVADVLARRGDRVVAVAGRPGEARTGWGPEVQQVDGDEAGLLAAERVGASVAAAFGANVPRAAAVRAAGARVATPLVLATTATLGHDTVIGAGTQVLEHAHVGPGSRLGEAVIVNTAAVVEHDCTVGEGVHLGPACVLLGAASVGEHSFVGSGARVLPGVRVGAGCVVGAGAVVLHDLPDGARVAGVPARPLTPTPTQEDQ